MATVKVIQKRPQDAHFGFYRTSAGGDEPIFVRRKIADPTDYMHTKSRKLQTQRRNFALANQHYARLTPSQKAITRHQFEWVEYQQSHGKTDVKLLMGRQLFIAKEIRSLNVTQKPIVLPYEFCIMLVDEFLHPLEGELWLRYLKDTEWLDTAKEELVTGQWLFSQVPRTQEAYRPYGEADNYYDPQLPELQFMTEAQIRTYHYHILYSTLATICHSVAMGRHVLVTGGTSKISQPFTPCSDFTLKEMLFSLRRYLHYHPPDLLEGIIAVHQATDLFEPIEPALATIPFTVYAPDYPNFHIHKVTFPSIPLELDKHYAWVIGFAESTYPSSVIEVEGGENGTCNLDPVESAYLSFFVNGYWQPWQLFGDLQLFYEMKA